VTVLDNASADATPDVCARWAERFADLRVVRHRRNVGGSANYLRAVELSRGQYTWVLADDDEYDFSRCDDVLAALEEGEVDLLALGAPGQEPWPTGRHTLGALMAAGHRVYTVLTFIPGVVFRTDRFTDRDLSDGYRAIDDLYPQWPFVRRMVEADATIHVAAHPIVRRGGFTVPNSQLYWFVRYVRNVRTLRDRRTRQLVVRQSEASRWRFYGALAYGIAVERQEHPERVWSELFELTRTLEGAQRALVIALTPVALGPPRLYAALRRALLRRELEASRVEERP